MKIHSSDLDGNRDRPPAFQIEMDERILLAERVLALSKAFFKNAVISGLGVMPAVAMITAIGLAAVVPAALLGKELATQGMESVAKVLLDPGKGIDKELTLIAVGKTIVSVSGGIAAGAALGATTGVAGLAGARKVAQGAAAAIEKCEGDAQAVGVGVAAGILSAAVIDSLSVPVTNWFSVQSSPSLAECGMSLSRAITIAAIIGGIWAVCHHVSWDLLSSQRSSSSKKSEEALLELKTRRGFAPS